MQNHSMASKIIAFLMVLPAISGCVEDSVEEPLKLNFSVDFLVGGEFQSIRIVQTKKMLHLKENTGDYFEF